MVYLKRDKMDNINFIEFDKYLLQQTSCKIIHQIWFGIIPSRLEAKKDFKKLEKYRTSWVIKNPTWKYVCWNFKRCRELMKTFFPEHLHMYDSYPHHIQRCDCVRYFILFRYGGLYADVDFMCVRPWDEVLTQYPNDLYIVETPNKMDVDSVHISNSLMYVGVKKHKYWKHVFVEMEKNQKPPIYYGRHLTIMYSTGPCIINRVFRRYKNKYKLNFYPCKLFHPFGLISEIESSNNSKIYAYHLGKGSWEEGDSKLLIFLYKYWKPMFLFLFLILFKHFVSAKFIT